MPKSDVYQITLRNWSKYNSTKKKGHRAVLVSTGFLSDSKIRQLSPATKLLFLSCVLLAGESNQSHFNVTHESLCFHSGVKSGSLHSQLDLLQQLQLLTFEKIESFKNRIEKKENRREENLVDSYESTTTVAENSALVVAEPKKKSTSKILKPKNETELMSGLPPASLARWAELYPDPTFLRRETIKAFGYYENNPKKTPKSVRGWSQALSSWFDRAWPRHVRQIESVANAGLSEGQFNSIFQDGVE